MSGTELRRGNNGRGLIDLIGSVFSMAGYVDVAMALLPLLREYQAIVDSVATAAGLKSRLVVLVKAGKIVADETATDADNKLVAQLEKLVAADSLIEFVAGIIARFQAENPGAPPAALLDFIQREDVRASLAEAAVEKAIDFAAIMDAIKLIMQIIALFKGATGSGGNTATSGDTFGF